MDANESVRTEELEHNYIIMIIIYAPKNETKLKMWGGITLMPHSLIDLYGLDHLGAAKCKCRALNPIDGAA